ncbi:MAG: hypothetical protein Ctma_1484 [Catillopecten margaritatus gill symbiont]|uniref:Peptidase S8/S53 domain-containing protein n=1 Tax=Catillopecten margaritatus gill symbiont TaxID=3083288 RepID=A0AAU6PIC2_9GAMM
MALDNYTGKYTGAGQTIVVIDQGVSSSYTNSNVVYSYDFADNDSNATNTSGHHGGQVANVAQQVASGVKIIHLKVFSDGASHTSLSNIEKALQWVVNNTDTYNITAVNLSLGSGNVQTPTTWSGSDEYQTLDDKGVVVTVASGNSAQVYPADGVNILASSDSVISVSATNSKGDFTGFSQNHKDLTDVAALGKDVAVIDNNGTMHSISGTSFSAPIIAAASAILQEAAIDLLGHKLTDEEILDLIQKTGDKITGYTINNDDSAAVKSTSNYLDDDILVDTLSATELPDTTTIITPNSDPGSWLSAAYQLPVFTTKTTIIKDSVQSGGWNWSKDDKSDYYTFTVETSTTVSMDFIGANQIKFSLHNENGDILSSKGGFSWESNDKFDNIELAAGKYYISAEDYSWFSNTQKNYEIKVDILSGSIPSEPGTPTPDTDDSSIAKAQKLGALNVGIKTISDSIDKTTDNQDFFQFELTQSGKVSFLLSKLSSDVDLNLYDANGNSLHNGWAWGSVDIGYSKELSAGTYYVEADYYDGANQANSSTYDLSLTLSGVSTPTPTPTPAPTPTPTPAPTPTPGTDDGSIAKAQDLGALSSGIKTINDSIDKITDNQDFFKFELTSNSKVDFLLSNLSSDVDLNLYDANGKALHNGWAWGSVDIGYSKELSAGIYYVEANYYDGANQASSSTYDLSLTVADVLAPTPPTPVTPTPPTPVTPTPPTPVTPTPPTPVTPTPTDPVGYTELNLANAVAYLETHQSEYNNQTVL